MEITAQTISQMVGGVVEGDPNVIIRRPAKIEEAQTGEITFLANMKYEEYAYTSKASALLVSKDFQPKRPINATLIRVDNVYDTVRFLLEQFGAQTPAAAKSGSVQELAFVADTAQVAEDVNIGHFATIGSATKIGKGSIIYDQVYIGDEVEIGENVIIHPGAKIYKGCKIGDRCIIHANAVIGADGFGFVPQEDGTFKKMPQVGIVILENDVEIGANTTIDRATMGSTLIKAGAKLDNLVMIAHNVVVGENTAIAAQTGIAGSAKIGDNCLVGGQVGVAGHLSIANGVKIQAQSGIGKNIKKEGSAWYGSPAIDYNKFLRSQVVFQQLPALLSRVKQLEKQIKELSKEK